MPMPKPYPNEDKQKFIARCAKILAENDPKRDQKQRLAMCYTAFALKNKK